MTVTTTPLWKRHQGDEDDTLDVGVDGLAPGDSLLVDAIHAEVALNLGTPVPLTAAVTDPVARTVHVQLSPWLDTAELGDWRFVLKITFAGGKGPITWPEQHATIRVHAPR